jgi:uncharacterized protein (DUF433 family)
MRSWLARHCFGHSGLAGESREAILLDYPYLESADIDAALAFAARHADHPIITAE